MDLDKHDAAAAGPARGPEPATSSAQDGAIRASDADRDRIADILRDALAEGRLDAGEHSERIDAVYRAKTVGELRPLVRDLPVAGRRAEGAAVRAYDDSADPGGPAENLVAVFSSSIRKGRWRVGRRTNAFSFFGNIEIDLTEALYGQRLSVINATSLFGNVEVRVPENISLRGSGTGIFGNFEVVTLEAEDPEAPVVVVNGYTICGNVEAKPKRGRRISALHDRLRKHLH